MHHPVWNLKDIVLDGRISPRLDGVSLEIPGGVTAVMGASGAGKSSLLGLLTDFEKPKAGSVQFHAPDSSENLPIFWSPQDLGLWPHLSLQQHIEYVRPQKPRDDRSITQWLEQFGLQTLKDSLPELLSLGERSRLALARALASEASVLVLDEPMVHVDPLMAHQYWRIVDEHIKRLSCTVVFSTHDPDAVLKYAQHVICLLSGSVSYCGPVETLFVKPPTRELAWLLGPCNWFSRMPDERNLPLDALTHDKQRSNAGVENTRSRCIRPAQLELCPDTLGRFSVESIVKAATVTEVQLRDKVSGSRNCAFVSRHSDKIRVGDVVKLIAHTESQEDTAR